MLEYTCKDLISLARTSSTSNMDTLEELEGKINENMKFIIDAVKEEKQLGVFDEDEGNERHSDLKAAMMDCILLQTKVHKFQQAVTHVQKETSATENPEDALMEHFETLTADVKDNLTTHHNYVNLLHEFENGPGVSENAESAENIDEDTEHSMVMTHEMTIPLDPITKKPVEDPVVNKICKHTYERDAIMQHIAERKKHARCPFSGCGNMALLSQGILEENVELKKLIERKKRGDALFFD